MLKKITIICDTETPVKHLLNDKDYTIYEAVGDENIFTLIKIIKENDTLKT